MQGGQRPGPPESPQGPRPRRAPVHSHGHLLSCTAFISQVCGAGLTCTRLLPKHEKEPVEYES